MTDLDLMRTLTQKGDRKIILLVMDGLGGLPREVGGSTELETAITPNLDRLAREGMVGLLHPVGIGISPGSGPGHLGLFGYDPEQYLIGRGVLEAVGIGLELTRQDVAARGNFCTVDNKGLITDRRAGRISTEECARMVRLIEDITLQPSPLAGEGRVRGQCEIEVIVKPVRDYRFVLILRGTGLSAELNETDPQKT
jgi:2,3-bisphosphoglycerate-independent phosphoglycerate mutase